MTKLLNFTRTQERRKDGVFVCFGMNERGDIYSSGGGNMNEPRPHFSLWENLVH